MVGQCAPLLCDTVVTSVPLPNVRCPSTARSCRRFTLLCRGSRPRVGRGVQHISQQCPCWTERERRSAAGHRPAGRRTGRHAGLPPGTVRVTALLGDLGSRPTTSRRSVRIVGPTQDVHGTARPQAEWSTVDGWSIASSGSTNSLIGGYAALLATPLQRRPAPRTLVLPGQPRQPVRANDQRAASTPCRLPGRYLSRPASSTDNGVGTGPQSPPSCRKIVSSSGLAWTSAVCCHAVATRAAFRSGSGPPARRRTPPRRTAHRAGQEPNQGNAVSIISMTVVSVSGSWPHQGQWSLRPPRCAGQRGQPGQ